MRRSVERLLSASGFPTEGFVSAEAFLERSANTEIVCIVLDIQLEGMSGIELRHRLTAAGSDVPVIFITAIDDQDIRAKAVDAGCVAILHKPFPADNLIDAIRKCVRDSA